MTDAKHEAPADPVSDRYRFDDEIAWLREAARYFSARDTKGEDRAHWANVYNAENARKLADRLAELSSNPCQLEAPAEGAGEHDPIRSVRTIMARAVERKDQETLDHARIALDALRARSSAPEAREEALGNLLAVIHGDGGHRALEVGTKQAALEAEQIVAGLFAAPSADKLRIAVEALELTKSRIQTWPIDDQETCMCGSPVAAHGMGDGHSPLSQGDHAVSVLVEEIDQALAALKAEGAA